MEADVKSLWLKLGELTWADPGFLKRGFISINVCMGGRFADFISFFLNIPWK